MIPPKIALYFCWAFCLYLLWRDNKRNPHLPSTIWLPTLWLMRCGSRTVDYWLRGSESGRWDPTVIGVMIFCGLYILSRRPCNWGKIFANNSAIFVFYAYLVTSAFWTEDLENPLVKIFRPVGDLIMALVVATEANPRETIITMFRRAAILLIPMSIVIIRYFPELGRMQDKHWGSDMWIGVTTHKNPLGQTCIISALAFLWTLVEARRKGESLARQPLAWLYLAMTYYLFNGGGSSDSRSSTAILCLIFAVALFFVFGLMRNEPERVTRRIFLGAAGLAAVALLLQIFGTSLQAVTAETQGKDATLSDRTYLWNDVIRIGMKHPIFGTGYGGFWVPSIYSELSPKVDNHPAEAHNGYLETFANLGFVGVGLLAWVILQSLAGATKMIRDDFEYGRLRLCLLFMVVLMNYSEATFPRGNHLWWFGFLIVAVYARPWVGWPEVEIPKWTEEREEPARHREAIPV
jgi:O-antigen ligase